MREFRTLILPTVSGGNPDLTVAGISITERQRRQLTRLGSAGVDLAGDGAVRGGGPLLLIEAGLLADERLISAFLDGAIRRGPTARPLLAIGLDGVAGGLAWLPAGSTQPSSDTLRGSDADRFDLSAVPTYAADRRRAVPLLWDRPCSSADGRRAANQILNAAQKGCLDWPARFIHPPIENAFVRLLWPSAITPNMISLLAFALGLYAAWCFASGAMWTGLLLALVIGPIDGIDGKLARTRFEFSRWGDLEHVGDKIVEYAWFAALAAATGTAWAWALAALIVCTALAEALIGEFYRRMTGAQLDDAGGFERAFRLVSGRRNTFFWCLLPFAWFDAWGAGLVMIAAYSTANFFIMLSRFFIRLAEYGRAHSADIAANLDATAYGMLDSAADESEARHHFDQRSDTSNSPAGRLESY
ncbi:MAG: CDP-alcohol phosphatidyltransferase family protein [Novosphingobium sp.]